MKIVFVLAFCGVATAVLPAWAAEPNSEIEQLKRELQELRQRAQDLERKLERLTPATTESPTPGAINQPPSPESAVPEVSSEPPPVASPRWSPASPLSVISRGPAYMNVALDALIAAGASTAEHVEELQLGGHDPSQRGFTLQNVELTLDGAVDPYFRGQANILFFQTHDGETEVELEEAFLETLSLPGRFQLRAGQYLTEFGRHNPTHPHAWSFVDTPLVTARFLGPDGLRNPGARLSWLVPTPFYSELFLSVQNSHGHGASSFRSGGHSHGESEEEELPFAYRHPDNDRGLRSGDDLLISSRYALSFDPTANQVVLLGASAAFGPNSRGGEGSGDGRTEIYGADFTWKWKSPRHSAGFPFVSFQTEAMARRMKIGAFDWDEENPGVLDDGELLDETTGLPALLPGERLNDYGLYSQLLWGFRKGWVAGLRGDFVTGERARYEQMRLSLDGEPLGRDPLRAERWRLSQNLTWYPTEFSKIRLQYNFDHRQEAGEDHSVWLQLEFLLGAHPAHKF